MSRCPTGCHGDRSLSTSPSLFHTERCSANCNHRQVCFRSSGGKIHRRVWIIGLVVCVALAGGLTKSVRADDLDAVWNGLPSPANLWSIGVTQLIGPTNWDIAEIDNPIPGQDPIHIKYPAHNVLLNAYFSAQIGPNGQADVLLNGFFSPAVDQLQLTNGSTLTLPETSDLILTNRPAGPAGMLDSNGTVYLTGGDLVANADLQIDGSVTFTGGGVVDLSDASNNRILGNNAYNVNATLIVDDHTIEGAGQLGAESLSIRNNTNGIIRANRVNNALVIDPGASNNVINAGLMEATSGGTLRIKQTAVNNTGGTIKADNASLVELQDVTISFGELTGTGVVRGIATVTLEGPITNSGNYAVAAGTLTILDGNLTNSGLVTIAGGSFAIDGTNAPGGQVTIDGGGTITLSVAGTSTLADVFGTLPTLTNADNTIQGAGNIGNNSMGLINQATIRADEAAAPLVLWLNNMTNEGTAEAIGGATLEVRTVAMNNSAGQVSATGGTVLVGSGGSINGGTVSVDGSGRLELSNGSVTGGTVNNTAGGVIATNQFITNRLSGQVNNPAGGTIEVADNVGLIFDAAGTYQNAGVIKLNGSGPFAGFAATRIMLDGQVTLSGGGEVRMTNASDNVIISAAGGDDTLINQDNWIHGSGKIGLNLIAIVNRAVISADLPFTGAAETGTLSLDPNAGGFTNEGTLEASNGGTLQLLNGVYDNAAGVIQALGGSTVDIAQGVKIIGGRLASSGSGQFRINANDVTFDGIGIELDGQFNVQSAGRLLLIGDVTNRGELEAQRVARPAHRWACYARWRRRGPTEWHKHPDRGLPRFHCRRCTD